MDTVTVTQRGELTDADRSRLLEAKGANDAADEVRAEYRRLCVELMGKSSVRTVAAATGLSTNTLQRWKREAD